MSSTATLAAIAEATGLSPVTVSNYGRELREASKANGWDLWVQSRPGGAHKAATPQPRHLASLILALGAAQPADAPSAVRELEGLVRLEDVTYRPQETPEGERCFIPEAAPPPAAQQTALRGFLEYLIVSLAMASPEERKKLEDKAEEQHWRLALQRDGGVAAWVSWLRPNLTGVQWTYGLPQSSLEELPSWATAERHARRAPLSRLTRIPYSLIIVAAEIWANTLASSGGLPLSRPDAADTSANSGRENAALARAASTLTNDRSKTPSGRTTEAGTGILSNPKARRVCANLQAPNESRIGHSPSQPEDRSDPGGTSGSDPACPTTA